MQDTLSDEFVSGHRVDDSALSSADSALTTVFDREYPGTVSADDFYRLMMKGGQANKLDDLLDEDE